MPLGHRISLAFLLALLSTVASAGSVSTETFAADVARAGQQYPGVDTKGRLYLLRGEPLAVYPVTSDGSLGEPRKLRSSAVENPAPLLDAQMDRHGDWVLLHGAEVRWFRSDKEEQVPIADWLVTAVELTHGRPLLAVAPFTFHRPSHLRQGPIPRLMAASGDEWSILVESDLRRLPSPSLAVSTAASGHLFVADDGEIWFAHLYGYHLTAYSAAGRQRLDVRVDGGKTVHREIGEPAVEKAAESLEKARARTAHPERQQIEVQTATDVILDLAEGQDGRMHLLVRNPDGAGLALDRLDTIRGVIERVALDDAVARGAMSLVAGRDGFYLVPFSGRQDRYLVRWEALEVAEWVTVDGVEFDGQAMLVGR